MPTSSTALAEKVLPKPHVPPALDAVHLPITAKVRKEFKLGKKAAGVVVVSVDPGGVGALHGLEPGEVITEPDDKAIRRSVDLDSMIRYKPRAGTNCFFFEGTRKKKRKTIVELTNEDCETPIALEYSSTWRAYNAGVARGNRGSGYRSDDGYSYACGGVWPMTVRAMSKPPMKNRSMRNPMAPVAAAVTGSTKTATRSAADLANSKAPERGSRAFSPSFPASSGPG